MNDILRNSILKLSDTRRSALIQRAELLEYNNAGYMSQIDEMDEELTAIDKELHRLVVINNELEEV
tara:strand:- start:730 stop:927 length:198 start_codon:yes stop_codon:yes gene_type:complete